MKIVVLIPCFNEEITIGRVVSDFTRALPEAEIIVFDNNSTDLTAQRAREAGATVYFERRQGKGYVVLRMFQDIDADVYVMVDGDCTYPAEEVRKLIEPILEGRADMVVGSRLHQGSDSDFRLLNRIGNYFFASLFRVIFRSRLTDILSGYRAFSRPFVRGVPFFGGGFEVEAELTVKALQGGFQIEEVPVDLSPRPADSKSKIRIVHDGIVILSTILALVRDYKPLTTFGGLGLLFVTLGLVPGISAIWEYASTGRLGSRLGAFISLWLGSLGALFIVAGLILHSVSRHFQELTHRLQTIERNLSERWDVSKRPVDRTTRNVR